MAERHEDAARRGTSVPSLPDFRNRLLAATDPVAAAMLSPIAAVGAVLAADLVAERPHPPRPIALRDGFALASIETVGASPYGPVMPSRLVPVGVGAELPEGCDAVIASDAVVRDLGLPMVQEVVAPGTDVLRAGGEIEGGARLLAAGQRLTATAARTAALLGHRTIAVRRPRIALHHAGGAEDVAAAGLVADLIGPRAGIVAIDGITAFGRHDADLHVAFATGDLGPAIGELAARGRLEARGTTLLPCETAAWGRFGSAPALVLPGRLDEIVVAFLVLIEPLLDRASGATPAAADLRIRLARKIVSQVGFTEVALLAPTVGGDWEPVAVGRASWPALARARARIELAPESEGLAEGTEVLARPFAADVAFPHGDHP